jgi:hypothetical protein
MGEPSKAILLSSSLEKDPKAEASSMPLTSIKKPIITMKP